MRKTDILWRNHQSLSSRSVQPEAPSLTINEENIQEYQTVTLTCSSFNGNPLPQYTWFRNGTLLSYVHKILWLFLSIENDLLLVHWTNKYRWQIIVQYIDLMSLVGTIESSMNVKYPIKHFQNHFKWRNIYMYNVRWECREERNDCLRVFFLCSSRSTKCENPRESFGLVYGRQNHCNWKYWTEINMSNRCQSIGNIDLLDYE